MLGLDKNVLVRFLIRDDESQFERARTLIRRDTNRFVWKDSPAEFADCLIGARQRALGCRATASFDSRAARLPGFVAV